MDNAPRATRRRGARAGEPAENDHPVLRLDVAYTSIHFPPYRKYPLSSPPGAKNFVKADVEPKKKVPMSIVQLYRREATTAIGFVC